MDGDAFLDLVTSRHSTYVFDVKKKVSSALVRQILDAARFAPSFSNSQPWKFIVVKNKKRLEKLIASTHYRNIESMIAPSGTAAPVAVPYPTMLIAFVLDPSGVQKRYDKKCPIHTPEMIREDLLKSLGMACLQAALMAESLGVSSTILTPHIAEANKILHVPKSKDAVLFLGLGYAKEGAYSKKKKRKRLSSLVKHEKW